MAVTHATPLRSAIADAVGMYINSAGSGTPTLEIRASSTILIIFNLLNPAFDAAVSGVITLDGVPIPATAIAAGIADNFVLRDANGDSALTGSVTATDGGGDVEVTNTSVATGQAASLTALSYTAPL